MQYLSTRTPDHRVSLSTALQDGLAPDGGLYVKPLAEVMARSHPVPEIAPELDALADLVLGARQDRPPNRDSLSKEVRLSESMRRQLG